MGVVGRALLLERASAPGAQRTGAAADATTAATSWPPPAGIVIVLAVLVVEAARTALAEFGVGDELSDSLLRSMVLFACFAFAFLGLIDDLLGTETDRGFRGHLQALRPRSADHRRDEAVRWGRSWPSSSPPRPAR